MLKHCAGPSGVGWSFWSGDSGLPWDFFWVLCSYSSNMAQSHTPNRETKGVHMSPMDQTWAMLSPAQGQNPPKERAVGSGTLTVALQANFYYPASIRLTMGLGGSQRGLQVGGDKWGKSRRCLLPASRETAANYKP